MGELPDGLGSDDPFGEARLCANHADRPATRECKVCGTILCETCVSRRRVENQVLEFCSRCGGRCRSLAAPAEESASTTVDGTFFQALPTAFLYPVQGESLATFFAFVLVMVLLGFLQHLPWVLGLGFSILAGGYIATYCFHIVSTSALGEDELPGAMSGVDDFGQTILQPLFCLFGTFVFSFAPFLIYRMFFLGRGAPLDWTAWTFLVLGAIYFPMGILAVALFDDLSGLDPRRVVSGIGRVPVEYLAVEGLFVIGVVVGGVVVRFLDGLLPLIGNVLGDLAAIYLLFVLMRVLGLLYRTEHDRLGWSR